MGMGSDLVIRVSAWRTSIKMAITWRRSLSIQVAFEVAITIPYESVRYAVAGPLLPTTRLWRGSG